MGQNEKLEVLPFGRMRYGEALKKQRRLARRCIDSGGEENFLFPVEHPPVITLGRSADPSDLRTPREELNRRGVEVVETNRGGKITFHGPGQLVIYPIIDLSRRGRDLHAYLRELEAWLIELLSVWDVSAEPSPPHTGVWVGEGKIASIGIAVRKWVAYHGVAINVNPEMDFFDHIVPCGLPGVRMESLASLGYKGVKQEDVLAEAVRLFRGRFGF